MENQFSNETWAAAGKMTERCRFISDPSLWYVTLCWLPDIHFYSALFSLPNHSRGFKTQGAPLARRTSMYSTWPRASWVNSIGGRVLSWRPDMIKKNVNKEPTRFPQLHANFKEHTALWIIESDSSPSLSRHIQHKQRIYAPVLSSHPLSSKTNVDAR